MASESQPPAPAVEAATPAPAPNAAPTPDAAAAKKPKKEKAAAAGSHPLEVSPPPEFFSHRIQMFDRLKAEYDEWVKAQPRQEISIEMPDGSQRKGTSWETSPMDIAKEVSKSLSERAVIAKVDGELWDLERPLEKSVKLELLDFEHPEGKKVFWHSSAHVLGEAAEKHYGCHLCLGPPLDEGFYYEMAQERPVAATDYASLETLSKNAVKDRQRFERLVMSKKDLLKMFEYNKYKLHFINTKVPDGTKTTVYRCGPMIDLCVGPHIPHTGKIKGFMVTKNSASYFLGDAANDSLQRIYGISFPDTKQLTEYKEYLAEAAKRDHRKIGRDQELFFFNELSPGSSFMLPHGTRIYNALMEYVRKEYWKRGYQEVISPNVYNVKLWETSGHLAAYRENMFEFQVEKEGWGMKPMNCPGHCVIFDSRDRSYKELPIRMAEFGVLHRNEASGALSGLTRVRRFVQDDAHIFCMQSQIEEEMDGAIDLLRRTYGLFDFPFTLELSTRPEKYLGEVAVWDEAEAQLTRVLDRQFPGKWKLNPGDGAFYGPKIDVHIQDALKRSFQCATFQLDFQLPQRFNLKYRSAEDHDGAAADRPPSRPVMIHRAIFGSIERFMGILMEHFAGKWPFWLSPRQVAVIPVGNEYRGYASEVGELLHEEGFYVDVDNGTETLQKKIRNAEIAQYNFMLVVGEAERSSRSVNIRNRDDAGSKSRQDVTMPLDTLVQKLHHMKKSYKLTNRFD